MLPRVVIWNVNCSVSTLDTGNLQISENKVYGAVKDLARKSKME